MISTNASMFDRKKVYAFFENKRHAVIDFTKKHRFKKRRNNRLAIYILIFFLESTAYFLLVKKLYFVFLSKLTMVCPVFGKRERCAVLQTFLRSHLVLVVGQIIWLALKNVNYKHPGVLVVPHSHVLESSISFLGFFLLLRIHIRTLMWTKLTNANGLTGHLLVCFLHFSHILLLWTSLDAFCQGYRIYQKNQILAWRNEILRRKMLNKKYLHK